MLITRVVAAMAAVSATFSIVWAMANLGYPTTGAGAPIVLAQACR